MTAEIVTRAGSLSEKSSSAAGDVGLTERRGVGGGGHGATPATSAA